ncbi:MAG: hypothetical protein F4X12_01900 [Acidobacteriia bacterium]|nr:hypothetical protein [Terriglobia bacterium]
MRAVKSRDIRPELIDGRVVHRLGWWYLLYRKGFPGNPDLALRPRRTSDVNHVILGCLGRGAGLCWLAIVRAVMRRSQT